MSHRQTFKGSEDWIRSLPETLEYIFYGPYRACVSHIFTTTAESVMGGKGRNVLIMVTSSRWTRWTC